MNATLTRRYVGPSRNRVEAAEEINQYRSIDFSRNDSIYLDDDLSTYLSPEIVFSIICLFRSFEDRDVVPVVR